ncbi:DbpA RNA binding domain-containing protein [Martelella endophytica]|uniref:DbpA RNA binding domain-containing protein n=1 Tax=Martelella endophytica TaxID=1486262 RepID=UPI000A889BE0|nr:DbpA RNA binding domain-containing protein [Martelella endophytica]
MICNAGGVTKRDVGRIKIDDTETRFEISADKAADYSELIRQPGSLEKGIRIAPAGKMPEKPRQAKPKFKQDGKPARKHQPPSADRGKAAKHKARKPKRHA